MTSTKKRLLDAALIHFAETGQRTVNVSDLSKKAGVARGTIYNNFENTDELFSIVSKSVSDAINIDAELMLQQRSDPHERLACFLGLFMKRAHDYPHWAKFVSRFAPNSLELRDVWSGIPNREVRDGIEKGFFNVPREDLSYYVQLLAGSTYSFLLLISEGHKSWRETNVNLIQLALLAGGISNAEAKRVALLPLPAID